jgi:hypothetical protein
MPANLKRNLIEKVTPYWHDTSLDKQNGLAGLLDLLLIST